MHARKAKERLKARIARFTPLVPSYRQMYNAYGPLRKLCGSVTIDFLLVLGASRGVDAAVPNQGVAHFPGLARELAIQHEAADQGPQHVGRPFEAVEGPLRFQGLHRSILILLLRSEGEGLHRRPFFGDGVSIVEPGFVRAVTKGPQEFFPFLSLEPLVFIWHRPRSTGGRGVGSLRRPVLVYARPAPTSARPGGGGGTGVDGVPTWLASRLRGSLAPSGLLLRLCRLGLLAERVSARVHLV